MKHPAQVDLTVGPMSQHFRTLAIPAALGMVWIVSPSMVFLVGAAFALLSLSLSQLIPAAPDQGMETVFTSPAEKPSSPVRDANT